jgi:hypothetical protein
MPNDLKRTQNPARPPGLRVIAFACFGLAAYLFVNGALIVAGAVSFASGRYLLGEYASMGPVIYLVVATVLAVLGFGLLRGWGLIRRLTIIAAAFLIATSVLPISAAVAYFQIVGIVVHGLKIIIAVIAIRYLVQPEVVEYFSGKSVR